MKITSCLSLSSLLLAVLSLSSPANNDPCNQTASAALKACRGQVIADYWLQRGKCLNLSSPIERAACMLQAEQEFADAGQLCYEQFNARLELCEDLGGGVYEPDIDPDDFGLVIDNPYVMYVPGRTFVYEKHTSAGLERIEFVVTHETKDILGVTCTVVHDIVTLNGVVQEDTFDWFAQDDLGNVWYFGELSFEYEDGEIVGTAGSWKAGENGASPGIVMLAAPHVDDVYRQEFLLGEAEDAAEVESLSASVSVPFGSFTGCLMTEDFSPLEPDHEENKFYAAGVGLVLELNPTSGARTELVSIEIN